MTPPSGHVTHSATGSAPAAASAAAFALRVPKVPLVSGSPDELLDLRREKVVRRIVRARKHLQRAGVRAEKQAVAAYYRVALLRRHEKFSADRQRIRREKPRDGDVRAARVQRNRRRSAPQSQTAKRLRGVLVHHRERPAGMVGVGGLRGRFRNKRRDNSDLPCTPLDKARFRA